MRSHVEFKILSARVRHSRDEGGEIVQMSKCLYLPDIESTSDWSTDKRLHELFPLPTAFCCRVPQDRTLR